MTPATEVPAIWLLMEAVITKPGDGYGSGFGLRDQAGNGYGYGDSLGDGYGDGDDGICGDGYGYSMGDGFLS